MSYGLGEKAESLREGYEANKDLHRHAKITDEEYIRELEKTAINLLELLEE